MEIMVSKVFLPSHIRNGQSTNFIEKILSGEKIHTIRVSADWQKRLYNNHVLTITTWKGAYKKSEKEIVKTITREQGLGYEIIEFYNESLAKVTCPNTNKSVFVKYKTIAKNDGLSLEDFHAWFENYDIQSPLILIHFTNFRYVL